MYKWSVVIFLVATPFLVNSLPVPEINDEIGGTNLFSSEIDDINIEDQKAALLELLKKEAAKALRVRENSKRLKIENSQSLQDATGPMYNFEPNERNQKSIKKILESLAELTENIRRSKRQLDPVNPEANEISTIPAISTKNDTVVESRQEEIQEEDFDDDDDTGAGNGLIGLIGSLSGGGNGMSDANALFAALAGILTNLLGENGIDVNMAIGSATQLLGGLLMRPNENLGATFAKYITTGVDGFSGGGAKNNGQFFGTFLGRLFAQLSAGGTRDDPSAGPPDSGTFFKSLISSFLGASSGGGAAPNSNIGKIQAPAPARLRRPW
ncbi:uncharacterized protein LOC113373140 [Ctenocephalides felis]|nr:uncharacterized protein LOC113373140 [Ctenocephalides felis]